MWPGLHSSVCGVQGASGWHLRLSGCGGVSSWYFHQIVTPEGPGHAERLGPSPCGLGGALGRVLPAGCLRGMPVKLQGKERQRERERGRESAIYIYIYIYIYVHISIFVYNYIEQYEYCITANIAIAIHSCEFY